MVSSFISSNGKNIAIFVGFIFASEVAWRIYKKYSSKKKGQLNFYSSKPIAEALFFSEQSAECRNHIGDGDIPCELSSCPVNSINKLVLYLRSATRSVDICIYFLTFNRLGKVILELHRKNINVRIITDDESSGHDSSLIFQMRKAGIKVRSKKYQYMMHHKFAIVDRKLLISGSANWTTQAFFGNCENVMVTNQTELVGSFMNEFEKQWLKLNVDFN